MICEYFSKKSKKRLDTIRNCDILRNVDSEKRQTSGRIAQSVEQGTENPRVPSSILGPATIFFALMPFGHHKRLFLYLLTPKKINNLRQTENYYILCFSAGECRYPLNSPFALCRGHEDYGLHKPLENNTLQKHTLFFVLIRRKIHLIYPYFKTSGHGRVAYISMLYK